MSEMEKILQNWNTADEYLNSKVEENRLPTFTLEEYERVKDSIPVGTKFIITDDEGGDEPEPTPTSDSAVEWFVIDDTHAINVENLTTGVNIAATGSWERSGYFYTICGVYLDSSSKDVWIYGLKYASSFSSTYDRVNFNATVSGYRYLIGFAKSDVETLGIKQITL